jgi:site-specific recombinase
VTPAPDLLERSLFITRFGASDVSSRPVSRLHALACRDPGSSVEACVEWLEDSIAWVLERGSVPGRLATESEVGARTRLLIELLQESAVVRARARAAVRTILEHTSATTLFTDTGLPTHAGFWRELSERLSRKVLPAPPVGRDVSRFVSRVFSSRRVTRWFRQLTPQSRRAFRSALELEGLIEALAPAMQEACLLLGARAAMLGTADDLRRRIPDLPVIGSPFLALPELLRSVLAAQQPLEVALREVLRCRVVLSQVFAALENTGISVDLVFRLELAASILDRLALLLQICSGTDEVRDGAWRRLEAHLIEGAVTDRSLTAVWNSNTQLLARRVVERAGDAGEHYLTRTRAEQHAMLGAAAGGGGITALLIVTKSLLTLAKLPLFFDALFVGLNYGLGFVAMQLSHFTLATKQPAMTAAALAGAIAEKGDTGFGPLVEQVARASRTQLFALMGNVGVVVPVAFVVDLLLRFVVGRPLLEPAYADKLIAAHHPWQSGTVFHAAVTGVWLWAASLLAGGMENWFVLRELGGAIASNRLLRGLVGAARTQRVARFMRNHISGFGGNLCFGLLLGFMPLLFNLVGIPLEVRHVTFVAGQLTYAAMSLGSSVTTRPEFLLALLSIPLVGGVNFVVSFSLALVVALRARGLGVRAQTALAWAVIKRFATSPREFFLAPAPQLPPESQR